MKKNTPHSTLIFYWLNRGPRQDFPSRTSARARALSPPFLSRARVLSLSLSCTRALLACLRAICDMYVLTCTQTFADVNLGVISLIVIGLQAQLRRLQL